MEVRKIPVEKLIHHPQNPRKEIGDITELTDSIKAKGILQNLTVVPEGDKYYVVIGNRRMEAAKAAGLTELPCVIAEMTAREQMETMLLENIQRVDLTIKEQADGFQLMMDLGSTVEDLSEKTGFAKSTIYHRLQIAKLDPKVLAKNEQVSMRDLIALEKVKDIKTRNSLLEKYGGGANFEYFVRQAAIEEEHSEFKEKAIKLANAAGIPKCKTHKKEWESGVDVIQRIELQGGLPDIVEPGEYYIETYSGIVIAKEQKQKKETKKEKEERLKAEERSKRRKEIERVQDRIKAAVNSFVEETVKKQQKELSNEEMSTLLAFGIWRIMPTELAQNSIPQEPEENNWCYRQRAVEEFKQFIKAKGPSTIAIATVYNLSLNTSTYYNKYEPNENEIAIIEILKKHGLVLDEEAEKLLDGTSELYTKETE